MTLLIIVVPTDNCSFLSSILCVVQCSTSLAAWIGKLPHKLQEVKVASLSAPFCQHCFEESIRNEFFEEESVLGCEL